MNEQAPSSPERSEKLKELRRKVMEQQSRDLIPPELGLLVPQDYAQRHLYPGGLEEVEQNLETPPIPTPEGSNE